MASSTLAKSSVVSLGGSATETTFDLSAILPEAQRRPRLFVGADDNGMTFYAWDGGEEKRVHQKARSFTAIVQGLRTQVLNAGEQTESTKLILDMVLAATGTEISLTCGAKTYSALSLVAAMSGLTGQQLAGEIGISGKAGNKGVVFLSVYADGKPVRNMDAEELLRESRKDDKQVEALEGYISEINARIKGEGTDPVISIATAKDTVEKEF